MKLLAKIGLQLAFIAALLFCGQLSASAQTSNYDINSGSSVFVFVKSEKSPTLRGTTGQQARKVKRRALVAGRKGTAPAQKAGVKKPAEAVEPIAPEEWINENADAAIEERKVADDEPLLFLSEGLLNERITGCSAPIFPAAARKAKLKQVSLKLSITVGKYGGVLDAQVISGDAIFRQAVYDKLVSMSFHESYFMGERVRIQGIVEFTQHDSDAYHMILCNESAPGVAIGDPKLPTVIDGGILNDNATSCEAPEFPADAKAANLKSVEATVRVELDDQGKVVSAKPIDGHPTFGQAAAKAAMKATFRGSSIANKRVNVSGLMVFTQTPNNDALCKNIAAN